RQQATNLALTHLLKHLDNRNARLRQFFRGQVPDLANVFAVLRIRDLTLAGKLVRFLTVLAAALSIALSGDGAVAAPGFTDIAGRQHEIDVRENVVHAVRVMFDTTRM